MTLLNYLKNSAGERGLHNALGRWRQKVSKAVDNVEARQFAYAKNATQIGIALNTNINLENNGLARGITRPGGSQQVFQLTEGKIYELNAGGYFDTFSDAAAGFMRLDWVDDADVRLNSGAVDACSGFFFPTTNATAQSPGGMPPLIYQAGATVTLQRVHLRVTAATGTAAFSSSQFAVSIVEIGDA